MEIAAAHYHHRDMDASTISDSYYYGSRNSIELQGYMSSSQAPDTNSYHGSSDCRVRGNAPLVRFFVLPFCLFVVL